ncbi:hypothetical protein [Pararhizobium mangrovi]|uniref:Uncharacterized protein n=1 Tax=Pararhizobium mangrovi TaxID=2590452 RepID=A0A506U961_9HYPH|nr:hypothetical protein [Pararhizobium mangrovi]TPW29614.1 hypothetical protein FJU11_07185 [Pararhizobium mangrovi]
MNLPVSKVWLVRLGTLIGLAGIVFVGFKLYAYSSHIQTEHLRPGTYVAIAVLAIVYALADTLLAAAWLNLLRHLDLTVGVRWSFWAYATSQLAKYVPGNVFQFAGRQVIGVGAGLPNRPLGKSILYELALLCFAACHFAPLIAPLFLPALGISPAIAVFIALAAISATAIARVLSPFAARAFLLYLGFLFVSGALFALVAGFTGLDIASFSPFLVAVSAYVAAWMIGLVTPGAPAGLGVREAVLIFLLPDFGTEASIVVAVLLSRIVTVLGDTFFYLSGHFIRPRS